MDQIALWSERILSALQDNNRWMGWNLFLALVPFGLSLWLFRGSRTRTFLWWSGVLVFLAFLPNAPYVLTDVIHLIEDIRGRYQSVWIISLVVIPKYFLFVLVGFQAYVLSLMYLGDYLKRQGFAWAVLSTELVLHALNAVGIYLGRFERFNSWDLLTQLDSLTNTVLDELVAKRPVLVMVVTFVIITGLYFLIKTLNLALMTYWRTKTNSESSQKTADRLPEHSG